MRTIRRQLTWKLLLGFAVPLVLGGAGVYFSTRAALLEQFDTTLRATAQAITMATEQSRQGIEVSITNPFLRESRKRRPKSFFQIWRADGTTLQRSESLHASDLPLRFGTYDKPKFWNLPLPTGTAGRAIGLEFAPRMDNAEPPSAPTGAILVVAEDRDELDEALTALALALFGCGAGLLAITVVVVPRLLRRELVPLDKLAEQAVRIDANTLGLRFPTDSLPGELMPISRRLNDLLGRLEQSFERERRFSADVAHELRTPIAELRSLAEVAMKWPDTREAATDRETLAIAVQMEGIVTRLLTLLRSERGQLPITWERIALAPLVETIWQPFADRAADKQLNVNLKIVAGVEVESDPVLLRSILTNLVDNAVEYTPCGETVLVDGEVGASQFTVRVTNTVNHLTTEDVSHFFERFWRKDPARTDSSHSGLGLPLARVFCERLGLRLDAKLSNPSTLSVTVAGPILRPEQDSS